MTKRNGPRILLVDDQVLFVESLRCVLEDHSDDLEVVGVARDGNEAVHLAMKLQPEIILMDVRMPNLDGVQATRRIHELYPKMKIVMLTTFDDDNYVEVALRFGAVGYLLKNIPPRELIGAVRAVMDGVAPVSPEVLARVMARGGDRDVPQADAVLEQLTRREREILQLVLDAFENQEIARELGISEQTVKNHVHNLYAKLGVSNRVQLIKALKG
jgi:DNA-binding NarL/FixJ family response regulator